MDERENVEVLFLGNITHENQQQHQSSEKSNYQDEISFADPVQIELIRIPSNGKQMYSRLTSLTQKQPIKSLEIYYRNLDKKVAARYSLLVCSSSELLVSSSIDILMTLPETIFTDLLVIRGNFTNITFCIYGRVLRSKQEIQKKCPYFINNIEVPLREDQPSIKIHRNVFDQSRTIVKAIEDEYSQEKEETKYYNWEAYSNDRQLYDSQITNICKLSQQLSNYDDHDHIQQRSIAQIRSKMQSMLSYLSKLFKSAHIGLYYPTPYRPSAIPEVIPTSIVKLSIKLLTQSLSDQYRTLQVLKLILQLGPHAQYFVKLNGINALIRLFLQFFSSDLIILSSLKSLVLQIFIVLSFWDFAANKLVDKFQFSLSENSKKQSVQADKESEDEQDSSQKQKSKQRSSRSRQKKKKKNNASPSKSSQKDRKKSKKEKKSKKNKERQRQKSRQKEKQKQKEKRKDKNKQISQQRLKEKKQSQKQKQKQKFQIKKQQKMQPQQKVQPVQFNIKQKIQQCNSFYEVIFVLLRHEKNCKLQQLMRIFILQITQTLTRNVQVSNQMAYYTPLLRDTKYMFNQGGQMINSKTLKTFASFHPFLNSQQSTNVKSLYVCQRQKINNPKVYGISPKLFKLIDSAISIFQSKSEDQTTIIYDQQFMTLVSALIENNKSGIAIGLGYFIQAIKIDTLLGLKKQEAVVAIICQYIHEVLIQDEGMNLIYYLDQIHNSMLKIINWLKQDRTFSLQIKRKVQYLINSALIYNHFSGTENNFKSFSEYFIKLIGHENFDIHKILDYSRKEYHKTVNPLAYANLAENFSLGNFHDVLPAQPLLQVDICLRMFLAILKLNKNIWTVFYQYKFVPAFATLYLKIHSLLKFFLTPSLQRQNALIDIKVFERLINNYIQVAIHLTSIFIHKWRYESAFNQLTEQQDIFDTVQLYQKFLDTYITLYNSLHISDSMLAQNRTRTRIKELFTNFVELFDVIFKGYELTKHPDRMRNLRTMIKYLYRLHYEGIATRAGVIGLLRLFVGVAGPATYEVIAAYLFEKNPKNAKDTYDVLLPNNQKSIFQNIFRRNIYRSDIQIVQSLSSLLQSLLIQQQNPQYKNYSSSTGSSFISPGGSNLGHMSTSTGSSSNSNIVNNTKEKIYQLIENILDENQLQQKQYLEEHHDAEEGLKFIMEKNAMFANFLAYVKAPMNNKIQQHMLRLLKHSLTIKNPPSLSIGSRNSQSPHIRTLKLRNSYLNFFVSVFRYNKQLTNQFFHQFIKISSNLLQSQVLTRSTQQDQDGNLKLQQLKGVLLALQCLIEGSSNVAFQSVMLFGEYIEKPTRPACEISLEKIFGYFKTIKNKEGMTDEKEEAYIKQIGICAFYLLCRLTTIDGVQFYSTECRKNALNMLVSAQKQLNLHQITQLMQQFVPKTLIDTIKNYLDFPIIQKPQSISNLTPTASSNKSVCKQPSIAYLYSKGVFTMISENEPVGRARFQLIQERWQGGDTESEIFKVNTPLDYPAIVNEWIFTRDLAIQCGIADNKLMIQYTGIHQPKQVNSLFHFKIRKIFTQDPKKNSQSINKTILMKNIPNQIKRPEPTTKQAYMNKLNTSPSLNRSSGSMTSLPVGGTSGSNTNIPPPNSMAVGQNSMANRSSYPVINPPPLTNPGNIPSSMGNNPNPAMNPNLNVNPGMNMNRSSSNNREPSPYNITKPPYVPSNKMGYPNSNQPYNMPINPNTLGTMNPVNPANPVMPNTPYYPQKNPVPYTQPMPKAMPANKPYNAGYDHTNNPMIQPPMYDPRVYYPPTTYDPRNAGTYHPSGYMVPQQTNYPQRSMQPAMGYPSPSPYPHGYQPQPSHAGHMQPGPKKVEQQMASQAIRILIYLQQNPNVPDKEQLKGKVNKLFQAPGVHERVARYFDDLKRN